MSISQFNFKYIPKGTKSVFDTLSKAPFINKYTLVGGTALSIQIKHRLSEDLDFIYDGEIINKTSIKRNIRKLFSEYRIIKEDENYQIDFIINCSKVTFFSKGAVLIHFNVKDYASQYKKMNIANPMIISTLKISAIAQRNTIRDYYDLYYLSKYILSLEEIIRQTKKLVPNLSPITYSETLIYTKDISEDSIAGHLHAEEIVSKDEISNYFIDELRRIKDRI